MAHARSDHYGQPIGERLLRMTNLENRLVRERKGFPLAMASSALVLACLLLSEEVACGGEVKVIRMHRSADAQRQVTSLLDSRTDVASVVHCSELCLKSDRCAGVNYGRHNFTCDLLEEVDVDVGGSTVPADGFAIYPRMADCSSQPCLNGGTCVELTAAATTPPAFQRYRCLCQQAVGKNCEVDVSSFPFMRDNNFFKVPPVTASFDEAEAICNQDGAHLATVWDVEMHKYLGRVMTEELGDVDSWISLRRKAGRWHLPPSGFSAWANGEPSGDGDCVEMVSTKGYRWNDISCTDVNNFVCELEGPNDEGE